MGTLDPELIQCSWTQELDGYIRWGKIYSHVFKTGPALFSGECGRAPLHPSHLMQPEAFRDGVFGDSFAVLAKGEKG